MDGPGTTGASFSETEFIYRRTTSTGAGAGSLSVYTARNAGTGINGLYFIHGKTGGEFFKIGIVGRDTGGPGSAEFITVDLECWVLAADGTTWLRDNFTNILTETAPASANDVTDAISLLTVATTVI
jgi:hypothetical protein